MTLDINSINKIVFIKYLSILILLPGVYTNAQVTNIKVDQFGYRTDAEKIAVITQAVNGFNAPESYVPSATFQVINAETKDVVLELDPVAWKGGLTHAQSGDNAWWLDFSDLNSPGFYYIRDKDEKKFSSIFRIGDDVYNEPLMHAVRMFYYQRCGVAKEAAYAGEKWQDPACHIHSGQDLACRYVGDKNNAATELDLSGGWHDAGDFNKYTTFTYSTLHNLLFAYENNPNIFFDNYNIPESGNGLPDILDEIKFELDWLLKMQLEDGSVLSKVSVTEHQGASPVSQDMAKRYYAPATLSATRSFASVIAHAYTVLSQFATQEDYANTLLTSAENAWQYIQDNPGYSNYDNSGFSSANPERSEYDQKAQELTAVWFLYKSTGNSDYLDMFESNINHFHSIGWSYWFSFEYEYQRVLIDYCLHPDADQAIVENVINSFNNSMQGDEFMSAVNNQTDAYRAYIKNDDYVWGSNGGKSRVGCIYQDYAAVSNEESIREIARKTAEDYLHFLHGVNAHGLVMLSNMDEYGAENYCREMYHIWFADGTEYDNADTSPKGPPPGFLTGGINKNYSPDASYSGPALEPPLNQPVQKAYKDWNSSWPENSWEITEPAIYYQAAYIHLLSYFANDNEDFETNYTDLEIDRGITSIIENLDDVAVYPNPVEDSRVWIKRSQPLESIELYNLQGSLIRKFKIEQSEDYLNLNHIKAGSYIMRLKSDDHIQNKLIIVR